MIRIWHPYTAWEDWQNGMWRPVSGKPRARLLRKAIEFTGDAKLYGSYMRRVIVEWPIGCEHHLTDVNSNRRAWIGHAATCLAIQCPEDITRSAWGYLSKQQQDDANAEAQAAIEAWEVEHERKNQGLHREVGAAGLRRGDTGRSGYAARGSEQGAVLPAHLQGDPAERFGTDDARLCEA